MSTLIYVKRSLFGLGTLLICLCLLSACGGDQPADAPLAAAEPVVNATPIPPGSCGLGDVEPSMSDEEVIRQVLHAEGELVVAQDIDGLMALWDADGTIADAKNTPDDQSDDQVWTGRDAIRHRYVRIVFPGAPAEAQPADLQTVLIEGGAVVTATTQIGNEVSPLGDRWELIQRDGCWLLRTLTYNLEAE